MKRRLSSFATAYYKFAPPALLIIGIVWMIVRVNEVNLLGALFYVSVLGFASVLSLRLKKVHLSSGHLYVSDYFRRTVINMNQIARVEPDSWGWKPRIIKLTLEVPSRFGSEIIFIPRGHGFLASEVADEILAAKNAA